jgi:tetratricopeptide (TPR) repeat protein
MKSKCLSLLRVISVLSLVVCLGPSGFARCASPDLLTQQPTKPKASEAEDKAVAAINSAPGAAAKLAAAGELLKKYPKSTYRSEVAAYVAGEISQVTDATQKLKLAEDFQKVFKEGAELELVQLVVLDGLLSLKRIDDAFSQGASILAKQPENVAVLSHLALTGAEEAKRQNAKYVPVSLQYGLKAIELIEANKKPANVGDANWERQKAMLPLLYLNMGILYLVTANPAEARARFEKASTLDPAEPSSYALLAGIVDQEYEQLALSHRAMPAGKEKDETLKKATERMDKAIDLYARALGANAGKPETKEKKEFETQILQSITPYYKYRHRGSTEGLQQLIDKYKLSATP